MGYIVRGQEHQGDGWMDGWKGMPNNWRYLLTFVRCLQMMARAWSLLLVLVSTSEAEGSITSLGVNRQGREGEWVILRRVKPGWGW